MDATLFRAWAQAAAERLAAQVYARCGDPEQARVAVREALVRAVGRRADLADDVDADAFVRKTAARLVSSGWAAKHPAALAGREMPSPRRLAFQDALDQLPAPARDALVLLDIAGLDPADAAAELRRPAAEVTAAAAAARDAVRTALGVTPVALDAALADAGRPLPSSGLDPDAVLAQASARRRRHRLLGWASGAAALTVVLSAVAVNGDGARLLGPAAGATTTSVRPLSCPLPAAWRTALSPDGPAWPAQQWLGASALGILTLSLELAPSPDPSPIRTATLVLHPRSAPQAPITLERSPGGRITTPAVDATQVIWGTSEGVKRWDGRTTAVIAPDTNTVALSIVDGAPMWLQFRAPVAGDDPEFRLRRFDPVTGSADTVATFRTRPVAGTDITPAGYFALATPDGPGATIYNRSGQAVASTDFGARPIGLVGDDVAWWSSTQLGAAHEGRSRVVWERWIDDTSGRHLGSLDGVSLAGDFLLGAYGDNQLLIHDLRTGQEATATLYAQTTRAYVATARFQNDLLLYSGITNPDFEGKAVPDGGPRLTPVAQLPRITC